MRTFTDPDEWSKHMASKLEDIRQRKIKDIFGDKSVEVRNLRFEELGERNEAGFCRIADGGRVRVDDHTWNSWIAEDAGTRDLRVFRELTSGPIHWTDWTVELESPFASRE